MFHNGLVYSRTYSSTEFDLSQVSFEARSLSSFNIDLSMLPKKYSIVSQTSSSSSYDKDEPNPWTLMDIGAWIYKHGRLSQHGACLMRIVRENGARKR